jgi:IMP dehydrogenase
VKILDEVSRTLKEFLLVPGLTTAACTPDTVDLGAPLVRHGVGEPSAIRVATPLTSAIMAAVSSPRLAIALAQCGGLSFIHQNQPVAEQAAMVEAVKRHKAGFRFSDITIKPSATLGEVALLLESAERDVAVVTDDGSPHGLFAGLISTGDFHPRRHDLGSPVASRMRPAEGLVTAPPSVTLSQAKTLIWDHRLDVLPVVDADGLLQSIVLRRDYELHKRFGNPASTVTPCWCRCRSRASCRTARRSGCATGRATPAGDVGGAAGEPAAPLPSRDWIPIKPVDYWDLTAARYIALHGYEQAFALRLLRSAPPLPCF